MIGKLETKNLRDLNEPINIQKRGGIVYDKDTLELILSVSDDTGTIRCKIGRFKYENIGNEIYQYGKIGDWYLFLGKIRKGFTMLNIEKVRKLERKDNDKS